jgi:type III pantothenate kinase
MTAQPQAGRERGGMLALSVGNTSVFGGVFDGERLLRAFRFAAADLIRLPKRVRERIERVAVCSVVPAVTPDVLRLVRRAWGIEPRVLTAESPHGLRIGYRRPRELGADRVAAALGVRVAFPGRNAVVVDCGTATTVTALRRDGGLLGGAIFPGSALWPDMLVLRTAQLPRVTMTKPRAAIGRSPREGIASGVYFGQLGAIREVVARVRAEAFGRNACVVVGTGGNVTRFAGEKVFDHIEPNLALIGLRSFAAAERD